MSLIERLRAGERGLLGKRQRSKEEIKKQSEILVIDFPTSSPPKEKSILSIVISLSNEEWKSEDGPGIIPGMGSSYKDELKDTVKSNCHPEYRYVKGALGSGAYGTVYQVCKGDNCDLVAKFARLVSEKNAEAFRQEIKIYERLDEYKLHIAPKLYDYFICEQSLREFRNSDDFPDLFSSLTSSLQDPDSKKLVMVLILEKVDGTLGSYIREYGKRVVSRKDVFGRIEIRKGLDFEQREEIEKELTRLYKILNSHSIRHDDGHNGNIVYKMIDGKPKWMLIDFGISRMYKVPPMGQPSGVKDAVRYNLDSTYLLGVK